jgi:hypothetical protein
MHQKGEKMSRKEKQKKLKMEAINIAAHNRMQNLTDDEDEEEFFQEHGHRKTKDYVRQSVENIAEKIIWTAKRIFDYRIAVAMGEKPPEALNRGFLDYQQYIIELVEPMILKYQQTKEIEATTSAEVIGLLRKGKITAKDAIELLAVIGKTKEVEEKELRAELIKNLGGE